MRPTPSRRQTTVRPVETPTKRPGQFKALSRKKDGRKSAQGIVPAAVLYVGQGIRRPNFFTGRLLTAEDFTAEQNYHRDNQRRHNLRFHGSGVVKGLKVTVTSSDAGAAVVVGPGLAIDPWGNELELCHATTLLLPQSSIDWTLGLRYAERPLGSVPSASFGDTENQPAHWEEGCEICLLPFSSERSQQSRDVLLLGRLSFQRNRWRVVRR